MAYPDIHPDCSKGLLLYGCAFNGKNDGQFFRAHGMEDVDVVDHHGPYVRAMQAQYPPTWRFHKADCLEWLRANWRDGDWDIVSVDAPHVGTTALVDLVTEFPVERLKLLASHQFVFGAPTNWKLPEGARIVPRSMDFCWWVWDFA